MNAGVVAPPSRLKEFITYEKTSPRPSLVKTKVLTRRLWKLITEEGGALVHDLLPESIESHRTVSGEAAFDVGGFDFAGLEWRRLRVGRFKPERVGSEREQSRRCAGA